MLCWQIPELFESCWRLLLEAPDILLIYIWWILWIEALHLATRAGMPGACSCFFRRVSQSSGRSFKTLEMSSFESIDHVLETLCFAAFAHVFVIILTARWLKSIFHGLRLFFVIFAYNTFTGYVQFHRPPQNSSVVVGQAGLSYFLHDRGLMSLESRSPSVLSQRGRAVRG